MRVLLVSTYESGHQPLHLAAPAGGLLESGHEVRALDLAVQSWEQEAGADLAWAQAVAFSVPMHTAMRLAATVARTVRREHPDLPICFYGLYARASRSATPGPLADRAIAGEYHEDLVAWVAGLAAGPSATRDPGRGPVAVELGRGRPSRPGGGARPGGGPRPARHLLPPLERYAKLAWEGSGEPTATVLAGYVEATRGCAHRCRHCPVPTVYDGRTRVVDQELVLADVAQLVGLGARHLTFGDPDFLNRPHHALRVVRDVHAAFPELTFDATVKVEHVLRHQRLWPELAESGCLFVVSAFECVDDATLARLAKGHTTADSARAVTLLRGHGIEVRPSFMPFTPWTTLGQVLDLVDFVAAHDLVANVDPVQYAIRLLVPEGSLLLGHPDLGPHLDGYDAEAMTWRWHHADPRVDTLQVELARVAEAAAAAGEPLADTYARVRETVTRATRTGPGPAPTLAATQARSGRRPRLTEPWFC